MCQYSIKKEVKLFGRNNIKYKKCAFVILIILVFRDHVTDEFLDKYVLNEMIVHNYIIYVTMRSPTLRSCRRIK